MSDLLPRGIVVRPAERKDVPLIAQINSEVFLGNKDNLESATAWIIAQFAAYPVYHYFVIEKNGAFAGYIGMQIHGGFLRSSPVVEVEQVGISRDFQGQGLGPLLMAESIRLSTELIKTLNDRIESHITFTVWAYGHNENALKVYEKFFTDSVAGKRTQYGDREEVMLRLRIPLMLSVRE